MAGRRIRNERDARECLAAVESSGLGRKEWAHSSGVDGRSLRAWSKKLTGDKESGYTLERGRSKRREGIVELIPSTNSKRSRYLVRCGAFSVEVDDHFDEETLERLLRIMASC